MPKKPTKFNAVRIPGLRIVLPSNVSNSTNAAARKLGNAKIAARRQAKLQNMRLNAMAEQEGRNLANRKKKRTLESKVYLQIHGSGGTIAVDGAEYHVSKSFLGDGILEIKKIQVQAAKNGQKTGLLTLTDLAERAKVIRALAESYGLIKRKSSNGKITVPNSHRF